MNFRYSLLVLIFFGALAQAACPDDAAVAAYVDDFSKRKISKGFGNDIKLEDAECAMRDHLLGRVRQAQARQAIENGLG